MSRKDMKKVDGQFEIPGIGNAMKTLLANIRFVSIDMPIRVIAITSANINEGKTAIATNLSLAIASSGKTCLLVDTDMRRRSIARLLGVKTRYGIYSLLTGKAVMTECIGRTIYPNLFFLDCEENLPNPPDILSTKRFRQMVGELSETFDYVIFDTPPVGTFVDAAVLSGVVDGTLIAIHQGATKIKAVEEAIAQLEAAEANILGIVMTFTKEKANNYYYAYYNEKGERIKRDHAITDENLEILRSLDETGDDVSVEGDIDRGAEQTNGVNQKRAVKRKKKIRRLDQESNSQVYGDKDSKEDKSIINSKLGANEEKYLDAKMTISNKKNKNTFDSSSFVALGKHSVASKNSTSRGIEENTNFDNHAENEEDKEQDSNDNAEKQDKLHKKKGTNHSNKIEDTDFEYEIEADELLEHASRASVEKKNSHKYSNVKNNIQGNIRSSEDKTEVFPVLKSNEDI